jgi:hypothetical protein
VPCLLLLTGNGTSRTRNEQPPYGIQFFLKPFPHAIALLYIRNGCLFYASTQKQHAIYRIEVYPFVCAFGIWYAAYCAHSGVYGADESGFQGKLFEFYPSVFTTGAYPKGNLSWHHLWFIAYLFVYDVVFAPVFKWCMNNKHKLGLFDKLAQGSMVYVLMLPSVIYYTATVLRFPETHALVDDWCYSIYWLLFLLAGFICMCVPSLISSLERNRRTSLTVGVIAIILLNYLRWNDLQPQKR